MPRFFFHTVDGGEHQDDEGTDLPGIAEARAAAVRYGGALLADDPGMLWDGREMRVEVADEDGRLVATIVVLAIDGGAADGEALARHH